MIGNECDRLSMQTLHDLSPISSEIWLILFLRFIARIRALERKALKPEPVNFLKVLRSNTFKKFTVVRLLEICFKL
jgi:hypothetical protein